VEHPVVGRLSSVPREVNDRSAKDDQGGERHSDTQQVSHEIFDLAVSPDWQADHLYFPGYIFPAAPL
jgi:hypothetical protein